MEGRRTGMRRPNSRNLKTRLRAGVSIAVIAEISPRRRIVGTIGLHAIRHGIVAGGSRGHRNGAIIVVLVVVVARRIIARPAIVAVTLRRERAANPRASTRAGDKVATTAVTIAATVAAAITAATATDAITSAAAT